MLSFKRPGVTARPVRREINCSESACSLFASERGLELAAKYTQSIHGLLLVLVHANYTLGNCTRKHVEQLSNSLGYI